MSEQVPGGGTELSPAAIDALDSRWSACWAPSQVARRLAGIAAPHDGETWICRRDERIRFPYGEIISYTADGIPYLVPELVLLFKAKHARPKDQADFEAAIPRMTPAQRAALADLLGRVHPGHHWLASL